MGRIPVGATIAHAYRFAFGGFVKLVRVSWLPQAGIIILLFAVLMPTFSGLVNSLSGQAPGAAGGGALRLVPAYLVMLLLFFVQITAVTRSALGLPDGGGWLIFPLGKPMWRLVGAFLLLMLVLIGIFILVGIVAAIAAIAGGVANPWLGPIIRLLMNLLAIFLLIRLGFFLAPTAIDGPDLGIRRSWKLSRGNFWRLFVILLGVLLPFIVLELVALFWLMPHMPMPAPGMDAAQYRMAVMDWEAGMFSGLESHWPIAAPLSALFTMLVYGLLAGAQAFAYRAATDAADLS